MDGAVCLCGVGESKINQSINQAAVNESHRSLSEKVLKKQEVSVKDIPIPGGRTKDFDIAIKMASDIYILRYSLKRLVREVGPLDISGIPMEIDKVDVKCAVEIIANCRSQVNKV